MRFRYLAALIAVAGLAVPAELLAEEVRELPAATQTDPSAPTLNEETSVSETIKKNAAEKEAAQKISSQTEPTLGAELEPHQDVDEVLKETERQFQEAQRELDQRFHEVEQEDPVEPLSKTNEVESALTPSSDPQVRAVLEETERRFEEASREIKESFERAERDVPREARDAVKPGDAKQ